ncbi:MAG: hypothetical protein EU542_04105 [Promethearchaeota archaeon]|nr:MAG: hypothetical protein EU542_04105 [Candidatus Lokiarchaeota archaeon]
MNYKRLSISFILGIIFGFLCLLGNVLTGATPYLIAALYNRIILGVLIGLAEDIKIKKQEDNLITPLVRGAIFGAFVSIGFAFFLQSILISFLIAGIIFGLLIDLIATKLTK